RQLEKRRRELLESVKLRGARAKLAQGPEVEYAPLPVRPVEPRVDELLVGLAGLRVVGQPVVRAGRRDRGEVAVRLKRPAERWRQALERTDCSPARIGTGGGEASERRRRH